MSKEFKTLVKNRLQTLGLSQKESEQAVAKFSSHITEAESLNCEVDCYVSPEQVANSIWGEIINPS